MDKSSELIEELFQGSDYPEVNPCPVDGLNSDYEEIFRDLLEDTDFPSLLSHMRSKNVLDLFGGGYFLGNSSFDSMTGVRLANLDYTLLEKLKTQAIPDRIIKIETLEHLMNNSNRVILNTNIWDDTAWELIRTRVKNLGINGFDLIACRPEGPFRWYRFNTRYSNLDKCAVYTRLFLNMTSLLGPNGQLYTQFPTPNPFMDIDPSYSIIKGILDQRADLVVDPTNSTARVVRSHDKKGFEDFSCLPLQSLSNIYASTKPNLELNSSD